MLKNFLTENVTVIINPSPSKVAHDNWSHSSGYCVGVDTTPCETLQAMSEEQQLACFSSAISTYMFIYSRRTEGSVEKKKAQESQRDPLPASVLPAHEEQHSTTLF